MIQIELYGNPVPWAAPRLSKKGSYDVKASDKETARWQIRSQHRDNPLPGAIFLDFTFFLPIPSNTSKAKKNQMLSHKILPMVRPDLTNFQKLYEDCLKGIVISDDNVVTDVCARKRYSEKPRVLIKVIPMSEFGGVINEDHI